MARNYHQGMFAPQNKHKYQGDPTKIVYRSSWERGVMRWLDENPNVIEWASEEVYITYFFPLDNSNHRYFVDFMITFADGSKFMVEVKPKSQTKKPVPGKKARNRLMLEIAEWEKNRAKWKAALEVCTKNGVQFKVWTEDTLRQMGIPIQ